MYAIDQKQTIIAVLVCGESESQRVCNEESHGNLIRQPTTFMVLPAPQKSSGWWTTDSESMVQTGPICNRAKELTSLFTE